MFDLGWSEMAIILLVALIVIGPKDLPRVAREVGKWAAKARSMAREFQRSLDDMAREAELQDIKAELEKASRTDLGRSIENMVDPEGELKNAFDPSKPPPTPRKLTPSAAPATPAPAAPQGKSGDAGAAEPKPTADQG
jgi:sec-independent protein translocase protein TatB